MDPNACMNELLMAIALSQLDEAQELAESLHDWLERDGFAPGGGQLAREPIEAFVVWVLQDLTKPEEDHA